MRTTLRLLVISSLALLLAGAAVARTRPHYGASLRIESSSVDSASVGALLTETLTSLDAFGRVQPLLAERWESQNGGRRWQFWLRANVRFHDGKTLSATDVAEALNFKQGAPWRTARANGVTLTFECDDPQPLLPAMLGLQRYAIAKTDASGLLIGTGPFRMSAVAGGAAKLVAFDDYWQGRPYLDAVEVSGGRGLRDQWMDLGVARADIVEVPAEQIRHAQQERMRIQVSRDMELVALVPSANSQALQNARMRQAIAAAIDRASLLNFIFQKQGEVSAGVLPNWMTGYDFLLASPQNVALARDLRGQTKQISTITIAYEPGDGTQQLLADRVVLNARDVGITMQSAPRSGTQADLSLVRIALASSNPGVALQQISSSVLPRDAGSAEAEPEALFRDESDLLDSYRVIPLLYVPRAFAGSQRIRNWTLNPNGTPAVAQFWLEDRR